MNDIYSLLTKDHNDKIDRNKDYKDFLNEQSKESLLALYCLYGYAEKKDPIYEIDGIKKNSKEDIINRIVDFIENNLKDILQFFNHERMREVILIANSSDFTYFKDDEKNQISLDTIRILKLFNLIFCKSNEDELIIQMPDFIKNKVKEVDSDIYLNYLDNLVLYTEGIINTYGIITTLDAYDLMKSEIPINYIQYDAIIKLISFTELEPIYYSLEERCIGHFNLTDEDIKFLKRRVAKMQEYDLKFYKNMASGNYIKTLNEYKSFRNYIKNVFKIDLNDDEFLGEELIDNYHSVKQVDENRAIRFLNSSLEMELEVTKDEYYKIIDYINNIVNKMPDWKNGGKIKK